MLRIMLIIAGVVLVFTLIMLGLLMKGASSEQKMKYEDEQQMKAIRKMEERRKKIS